MTERPGLEDRLIDTALRTHGLVVIAVLCVLGLGVYEYTQMPVDAFPDISPIMVPVFAEAHGMAPEEIERLITFPIEAAMNGLPGVTQIKSTSAFGMAVIYVYFTDATDIYFARNLVGERLAAAMGDLPEMHDPPTLGPISTGLGQIFIYYLTAEKTVDTEGKDTDTFLRELNDWVVKRQLQGVPGVTDVLSVGGHVLQYQIRVDPYALRKYDLGLNDLVEAVRNNNRNVGGQFLVLGSEEHLVRGLGLLGSLEDIRKVPLKVVKGTAVRIGDVAEVEYGNEIRRGVVSRNAEKEVVSGMVLKLYGENTSKVIADLYEKIAEVRKALPAGVKLVPYYEQAELVRQATGTVKQALLIGAGLVVLTLAVFLGNLRSAFIVALSLPICALISVIFMQRYGVSANLMSLGGIAIGIGMLGDGSIVMVENIYRHLSRPENAGREKLSIVHQAAREVTRPIAFSITIIVLVFLPIFALEGVEGKMFRPLAFTISFALLGSMATALIAAPVLSMHLLRHAPHRELFLLRWLKAAYRPLLGWSIRLRWLVALLAVGAFAAALAVLPMIGTEFVPTLEEGSVLIGVAMAPSISLEKATETVVRMERDIMKYGEVKEVISRIGRPEAGTHPHPVNYAEVHIELKPPGEWPRFQTKAQLVAALNEELSRHPGVQLNFTQPIQNAFDELLSGTRAQLAIKVYGEDLDVLRDQANRISAVIEDVPGLVDLSVEQSFGQPQVQIVADREACSRRGVSVSEVLEIVELAVGGEAIDSLYLHTRRFGIHVRFQEAFRADPEAIGNIQVRTASGERVPLSQVAEVRQVTGPIQINREKNQRRWVVQGNVRGRDLGGVFADVRRRIEQRVQLPPNTFVEYGGQFENQQRAMGRLSIIVPIVIAGVFLMLWMTFGSYRHALVILVNVPLALIGGVAGLLLTREYLSVPASVGFIALFGIAVQNGLVLVGTIRQLRNEGRPLHDALTEACMLRLRPVLMTATTTILGLLPLLLSGGLGSEVQRPLAVVVVFGLATSTLLTLFVIPAVYGWFEGRPAREQAAG
ncbi:MAG TPA: CusA/CzcA family heavy metal efflux RND transporter [Phycisphaerae bacterium]|nr:CusA/CzcA family heavy metal efflux RND transporter [Phycisphaerae bacterium]